MINKEQKYVDIFGYKVYNNGSVIGLFKKEMKKNKIIKIKMQNKYINIPTIRLIYYAFNQDKFDLLDIKYIVIQKDNDCWNFNINNLKLIKRNSLIWGENHPFSKVTNKQVCEIKDIYKKDGKSTYRSLAKEYNVSHTFIYGIVKGILRNEENYKMKEY